MADLLWEPQPGESGRAFAAFAVYRDLGPDRSLDKAYAAARQDQSGIKTVPGYWRQWCVRYQWVDRAAAYDAAMRAKEQAARERAQAAEAETWARRRAEEAEQEWAASRQLLDKARLMLQFPLVEQTTENGQTVVKPARWALRDAAALLDTAAKLARLAAGHSGASDQFASPG
jgi:hypothetical protein